MESGSKSSVGICWSGSENSPTVENKCRMLNQRMRSDMSPASLCKNHLWSLFPPPYSFLYFVVYVCVRVWKGGWVGASMLMRFCEVFCMQRVATVPLAQFDFWSVERSCSCSHAAMCVCLFVHDMALPPAMISGQLG